MHNENMHKGEVMNLGFVDYLRDLLIQASPWQSMLAGALVGLLPAVLTIVVGQFLHRRMPMAEAPQVTAMPQEERLLTCVMCKETVTMSTFPEHVAAHRSWPRQA